MLINGYTTNNNRWRMENWNNVVSTQGHKPTIWGWFTYQKKMILGTAHYWGLPHDRLWVSVISKTPMQWYSQLARLWSISWQLGSFNWSVGCLVEFIALQFVISVYFCGIAIGVLSDWPNQPANRRQVCSDVGWTGWTTFPRQGIFFRGPMKRWTDDEWKDTLWLCQNSYWQFIVDFPIKNCDFP